MSSADVTNASTTGGFGQPIDGAGGILTPDQVSLIVAFERVGASLSVVGMILVFIAFTVFKRLRTVPNTFIVFASFANLGASVACLIGDAGMIDETGALCQAQAFLFELFMQSDPWWSFAMAVNVYMVFFFAANPQSFLGYWWAYCFVCYGIPFVPSLWLLLIRGDTKDGGSGMVYGNASIWCWIDTEWSNLRIYTYYLPIWVCILLSTCIYFSVGWYVFKQRNQLRNLSLTNPARDAPAKRDSGEKDLFSNAAVMGMDVITEVTQETTSANSAQSPAATGNDHGIKSSSNNNNVNWFDGPIEDGKSYMDLETESPPSPNPYHTVTRITANPKPKKHWWSRMGRAYERWVSKFSHMDPVKLAYLRTSFVFAISVLVTWTPSSINRVHDLIYPGGAKFSLNMASGIVLPLQGVWNAVIFFTTSSRILKEEVRVQKDKMKGLPRGYQTAAAVRNERERGIELDRRLRGNNHRKDDAVSSRSGSSTMRVIRDGSLTSL